VKRSEGEEARSEIQKYRKYFIYQKFCISFITERKKNMNRKAYIGIGNKNLCSSYHKPFMKRFIKNASLKAKEAMEE